MENINADIFGIDEIFISFVLTSTIDVIDILYRTSTKAKIILNNPVILSELSAIHKINKVSNNFDYFMDEYNHRYRRNLMCFNDEYHLIWAIRDKDENTIREILSKDPIISRKLKYIYIEAGKTLNKDIMEMIRKKFFLIRGHYYFALGRAEFGEEEFIIKYVIINPHDRPKIIKRLAIGGYLNIILKLQLLNDVEINYIMEGAIIGNHFSVLLFIIRNNYVFDHENCIKIALGIRNVKILEFLLGLIPFSENYLQDNTEHIADVNTFNFVKGKVNEKKITIANILDNSLKNDDLTLMILLLNYYEFGNVKYVLFNNAINNDSYLISKWFIENHYISDKEMIEAVKLSYFNGNKCILMLLDKQQGVPSANLYKSLLYRFPTKAKWINPWIIKRINELS